MKDKKAKQLLSGSVYQWEGLWHKEMVKEGEYSGNILFSFVKIE
jgi:hypothetical protein